MSANRITSSPRCFRLLPAARCLLPAACCLLPAACCLLLSGCGGDSLEVAPVSGKVTLDGRPIANVRIFFQPTADGAETFDVGPGSYGKTDAEGRFTLQLVGEDRPGAVPGKHGVRMTTVQEEGIPDDASAGPSESVLPPACRDGSLQFEVPPSGTEQADFDLKSQ